MAKEVKWSAMLLEVRNSVVEILERPTSDLAGHQAFKSDQKLLALWASDCAEHVLPYFERVHPRDRRPRRAIESCRRWAKTGEFHMADIRKAALDAHAAARIVKEEDAKAAARAAGHAVATAHVPTHCLGAAIYALKAANAHDESNQDGLQRERKWQVHRLLKYAKKKAASRIMPKESETASKISSRNF